MNMIAEVLQGTPWWVYLLFIYLLFRGVKALKTKVVPLQKLFILPIIFLVLSFYRIGSNYQEFIDLIIWLFFLVIGYVAGWGLASGLKVKADKKKILIKVPGSPVILILVLLLFASRYFFGVYKAMHPEASGIQFFHWSNLLTSGLFTGIFLGRFVALLRKFQKAKHTNLKKRS